jgi:TrmH family RNA methyltransferase
VTVVLDHPQDVVNIAGVIRVMMNFGLSSLRLVEPEDFDPYRIEGIAHRSMPIIRAATVHETLADAVADCSFVVGTTARARTEGRTYTRPREAAADIVARAREGRVAMMFGREDKGLFNEGLDLCHVAAIIPTDPAYPSLNLAQACLLMAYETFLAAGRGTEDLPKGKRVTRPPNQDELERTYRALESGLEKIDFFKGSRRPEAVMRTLRTLITRAGPDLRETRMLGAIGFEIGHYIERLRADERKQASDDADGSTVREGRETRDLTRQRFTAGPGRGCDQRCGAPPDLPIMKIRLHSPERPHFRRLWHG